ncbi:MAG: ABC transporter ATP-binding protein [Candidatus Eisenbacteria bacterium]
MSASNGKPWIELDGVDLARGGRPVLRGVSATLSGRAIGLVGANGAGKSTLIGALLGVLRAQRGRIRVMGLELPQHALEVRTRAGVMAEQAGIFPGGSGVDAVAYAGQLNGLPRREALRRAHRALDALGVGEERYRATEGYSTGMRQRCKLAMSLCHDPEVLILDEPTVGLDPAGRIQLLTLIRGLAEEGRRILLSTHVLHDAEFLCDEMLLLESGTVAYAGPVATLVDPGAGSMIAEGEGLDLAVVESLLAAGLDARLEEARTRTGSVTATRLRFLSHGDTDLTRFWAVVARHGAEVRRLRRDSVSLEDAVLTVMDGARERSRGGRS